MKVAVVRKTANLDRARGDMEICSFLENRTDGNFSIEYKDSTGNLWKLNATPMHGVATHNSTSVRYSVAFQSVNGWANTDGPFIELKDALDVVPDRNDSVILLLRGDGNELPVYAYDSGASAWRTIK